MSSHRTILFAEDNPNDIELTLSALGESQLANHIVTVSDGVEALDYLFRRGRYADRPEGDPAFVLLDLKMPKLDGIDVLRAIRENPQTASLPVIMLTSSREEQDLARSYELGINAYVVKPVGFENFIDAVRQLGIFWAFYNEPPLSRAGTPT